MEKKRPCGCGGVSLKLGQNASGVNNVCHGFTGGVTAHQGHVVPTPKVVLVYWDQFFTDTSAAVTSMDQFASDLASGNYWDGLGQYGVGAASIQGHVVIDMKTFPTPNSQHSGQAFSESQMQSQLTTWLDKGAVTPKPAGNEENLVYLIFAPTDTTLSLGGQTSGFCGYHEHGKYHASTSRDNLIWATVQGYTKSSTGTDFVNSISFCVSHELSEAFTNPDDQGYFNDNGCEIGDICEASARGPCCITVPYTVAGRTWQVEKYWSNLDSNCIIGPSLTTAANTPIDGYATTFNDQQHVNFIGSDGHVHELVYSDHWGHTDLTQAAKAPNPAPGSPLDGYQTTFNNQQHVNYIGTDGHVHELVYTDHWRHTDLM